jgi:RNA polymerase sigma-70 factor (ECF subfamily)
MTDEELIEKFYEGDREALAVIFERHKEGVFNFALRMVNNRADAEDIISDTFGRVCDSRNKFVQKAKFKTWLYTIARHACIDKIRSRRKWGSMWFEKKDSNEQTQMDFPSDDESASQVLDRKEVSQHIQSVINKLPSDQREAIMLREFQELAYDEIAQMLGCSLANVKILIYRARVQLKDSIPAFVIEFLSNNQNAKSPKRFDVDKEKFNQEGR